LSEFPPKPRWMRWRTYQRLVSELTAVKCDINKTLLVYTARRFPELVEQVMRAKGVPIIKDVKK
jgi:hypothetical protein